MTSVTVLNVDQIASEVGNCDCSIIIYVAITWTPHIYGWAWGLDAMYPGGGIGEYACRVKELWIKIQA